MGVAVVCVCVWSCAPVCVCVCVCVSVVVACARPHLTSFPHPFTCPCFVQVKGRFPNRVLRRHFAAAETLLMEPHFTEDMAFIRHIIDKVSGKPARRIHNISNPTKDLTSTVQASRQAGEDKYVVTVLCTPSLSSCCSHPCRVV